MMENMWVHRVWSSDPNLYIPIFLLQFRHYNTHCLYNVYTTHSTSILYYPIYYSPTSHLIVCCCISPPNSHPHTTGGKAATRPQPHTVPDPSNPYVRIYIYKYIHSTTYIWPIYYLYFGLYCPTGKKNKKTTSLPPTYYSSDTQRHLSLPAFTAQHRFVRWVAGSGSCELRGSNIWSWRPIYGWNPACCSFAKRVVFSSSKVNTANMVKLSSFILYT